MNGVVTPGGLFDLLFITLEIALLLFASRQALSIDGLLAEGGRVTCFWSKLA